MMQNKIIFSWEGNPPRSTFQQRDKEFRPTANARLAFAQWKAILERYVPAVPMEGALSFRMILTFPHTAESIREKDGLPVPKITRPDGVNIMKGVEDIMTKLGYWHDDSQLASETVERWHGEFPGVTIIVESWEDGRP